MNNIVSEMSIKGATNLENGRPFLRWAGSKRQILPILAEYFSEEYERYIEPFAGSAALFFRLLPKRAVLGDLNLELMSTYRQVKHSPDEVISELSKHKKNKVVFLGLRKTDPKTLRPAARAARFIYLNRNCYNGLYRTNANGRFNVPYGGVKSGNVPSYELLHRCSKALRCAKLISGDFEKTLLIVHAGDFVYMDPPFSVSERRVFTEYGAYSFTRIDVSRLRSSMEKLHEIGARFVVSYADSDEARALERGFYNRSILVKRNIAGYADSRTETKEIIISNTKPK
jgi:DNA adenine methylase